MPGPYHLSAVGTGTSAGHRPIHQPVRSSRPAVVEPRACTAPPRRGQEGSAMDVATPAMIQHYPPESSHHNVMRLSAVIAGQGHRAEVDPERAAELRANPNNRLWLDIVDPGRDQIDYL